jgi:cytochrome b6-f complex iron-sulfur subunit
MKTSRREFLGRMGVWSTCACAGFAGASSCSMMAGVSKVPALSGEAFYLEDNELIIDLTKTALLNNSGDAAKLVVPLHDRLKLIIILDPSGQYLVFSDKCDHGGRELNYLVDQSKLQCSSFGHSEYDLDGNVLKGPAKNALPVFKAQRQGQLLKFSI